MRHPEPTTSLRQLRYFVAVAEEGQMTRAASRLHLAQPALSQAISQLEAQVGAKLLERHPRGVRLTAPGAAFFGKAQSALAAMADADSTAESLSRTARGVLEIGYLGPAPCVKAPELLPSFATHSPQVEVSFSELPFPWTPTSSWLRNVDVALCHLPPCEQATCTQLLCAEARMLVVPDGNPLARESQVDACDVLEEVFIAYHPDVQREWAGFHSLDDCRGGPPQRTSADRPLTPSDMLAAITSRRGVTALPAGDAAVILKILRGVSVVALRDARPFQIGLVWRKDDHNPYLAVLAALARASLDGDGSAPGANDGEQATTAPLGS